MRSSKSDTVSNITHTKSISMVVVCFEVATECMTVLNRGRFNDALIVHVFVCVCNAVIMK